jgi:hypothetical protein
MEAIQSSYTSLNFHPTTWRYTSIIEDRTLHGHRCENLKSKSHRQIKMMMIIIMVMTTMVMAKKVVVVVVAAGVVVVVVVITDRN